MNLKTLAELLEARVHCCDTDLAAIEVASVGSSDLMSDILNRLSTDVLLTGLNTNQVVNTAAVANIKAVVLVRGKTPDQQLVEAAKDEDVVIMSTTLTLFEASGRLYEKGLRSASSAV